MAYAARYGLVTYTEYPDPHNPSRMIQVKANHRRFGDRPCELPAPVPTLLASMGAGEASTAMQYCGVIAAYCYEAQMIRDYRDGNSKVSPDKYNRVSTKELQRVMALRKLES